MRLFRSIQGPNSIQSSCELRNNVRKILHQNLQRVRHRKFMPVSGIVAQQTWFFWRKSGKVPLDVCRLRAADRAEQTLRNLWEYYMNIRKFALASALRQQCLALNCNIWSSTNAARKALKPSPERD
jgi:hypothetical protein